MREILFRGKRIDNGEWVEGFYNHIPYGRFGKDEHMIQTVLENGKIGMLHDIYPCTVGQYTGLKDKNGKRIFEGDIAKVLQGKDKDIAYVGFENGAFMLYPKTGNIYERTLWEYWYNDWDVEVIGNITDNPELLKK